jgi:hypothetical protein
MNLKKLQEAYMSSITADEGSYFVKYQRVMPEFDAIIVRDVSGSTDSFKNEYAESTIVISKALESFNKVNLGVVDFSADVAFVKYFDEELEAARIHPVSKSRTNLGAALNSIAEEDRMVWKNNNKLVIIITDGYPDSIEDVQEAISKEYYQDVKFITVIIGYRANEEYTKLFGEVKSISSAIYLTEAITSQIEKVLYQ